MKSLICCICDREDPFPLYKGLVKCGQCGFVWADLSVDKEELKKIYADNYFFGGEYKDYLAEEVPLTKDFKSFYEILSKYTSGGKMLELGSAYGFSLNLAKSFFSEVTGVEINKAATDYSRKAFGLNVREGDFLEMDFPDQSFDVIVCWATLEHLQAPDRYIQKISKMLKPGGWFACTTVDIDGIIPRLRKSKWRQIHPPTHVSYFSAQTLETLLKKFNLNSVFSAHVGNNRSFDNVLYGVFVLIYKQEWLYRIFKKLGFTRGSFYLNLYDLVYMVARKSASN